MKLKVITSNPGKVAEYQKSFDGLGIEMEHLKPSAVIFIYDREGR